MNDSKFIGNRHGTAAAMVIIEDSSSEVNFNMVFDNILFKNNTMTSKLNLPISFVSGCCAFVH